MSILQGLGAAGAVLNGAANLVRSIKQPGKSEASFAEVLRQTNTNADPVSKEKQADAAAARRVSELMTLRDINGDGFLSRDEIGLKADDFAARDLNGDGRLSPAEMKQAVLRDSGLTGLDS